MGNTCCKDCKDVLEKIYPSCNMKHYLITTSVFNCVHRDVILWLNARNLIGHNSNFPQDTVVILPLYWPNEVRDIILDSISNGRVGSPMVDSEFYRPPPLIAEPTLEELRNIFKPLS